MEWRRSSATREGSDAIGHNWKALLFDVDGTLITSGGAGAESWKLAFDELYGIPADIGEFTDNGMTDPDVGRQTFMQVMDREPDDDEFSKLLDVRLGHLRGTVADSEGYRILEGVQPLLKELVTGGYLLGLVTGNLEAAAHIKLHRARLNHYFAFGGYGSDADEREEVTRIALRRASLTYGAEISPDEALVIGDTPNDVQGAHDAGIKCVAVASHNFDAEQLRDSGADWVIESLTDGLPL